MCLANNMDQLIQLQKALTLANDHGLTTGLPVRIPTTPIVASTPALEAQMPVAVVSPLEVEITILITTGEIGQLLTGAPGFYAVELSPSPSYTERNLW